MYTNLPRRPLDAVEKRRLGIVQSTSLTLLYFFILCTIACGTLYLVEENNRIVTQA